MVNIVPSIPVFALVCHHGTLGIARSLGRLGVDVYGVDRDATNPAFRSRYFKDRFEWDMCMHSELDTIEFLCQRARATGQKPLLIPTSDETTLLVAQNAASLSGYFVFARQSAELIRKLVSKRENYLLARGAGIPVPRTVFPRGLAEVQEFAATTAYPVMVKGINGARLATRTGHKMVIADSPKVLLDLYDRMEDPDEPNIMLQEYIPGGDDTIWMFNGYFDQDSNCRFGITGRKLRQTPPHMGSTSLGVCERNDTVFQLTTDFMHAIGYTGILDIGFRYDARDGSYKLLDPNPRIGSTFRLFVGDDGMDTARYLYSDMTGQPLPTSRACEGRKWFVENADIRAFSIYRQEGTLTARQWLRSFRGVSEAAWFAYDDLGPFWPVLRGILAGGMRYMERRARRVLGSVKAVFGS